MSNIKWKISYVQIVWWKKTIADYSYSSLEEFHAWVDNNKNLIWSKFFEQLHTFDWSEEQLQNLTIPFYEYQSVDKNYKEENEKLLSQIDVLNKEIILLNEKIWSLEEDKKNSIEIIKNLNEENNIHIQGLNNIIHWWNLNNKDDNIKVNADIKLDNETSLDTIEEIINDDENILDNTEVVEEDNNLLDTINIEEDKQSNIIKVNKKTSLTKELIDKKWLKKDKCLHCWSKEITKAWVVWDKQRFKCKNCKKFFLWKKLKKIS